ncbi:MAG: gliding motility-associated C-terminal domain-containing protein [Flavobacteriales bacterium]|nr:gliding motility-associated C-terminal domain-containing protein [Flavobacteriales bacterium]
MEHKLNGFEKMINESLENFEMPFDPSAWSQIASGLDASEQAPVHDAFENTLQNKVNQVEVPYDASQWSLLESSLHPVKYGWWIAAGIAGVVGISSLIYFSGTPNESQKTNPLTHEKTIAVSDNKIEVNNNNTVVNADNSIDNNQNKSTIGNNSSSVDLSVSKDPAPNDFNADLNKKGPQDLTDVSPNDKHTVNPNDKKDDKTNPVDLTDKVEDHSTASQVLPSPEIIIGAEEFCSGQEIEFSSAKPVKNYSCVWEINGNGLPIQTEKLSYYFSEPGIYSIALYYTNGKEKTSTVTKSILVKPAPVASFRFNEEIVNGRPIVHFENNSSDFVNAKWLFPDGTNSSASQVDKFFRHKGDYKVMLGVTAANGCSNKTVQTVHIEEDFNLLAPNAFSPNGDNTNNTFIPFSLTVMDVEFVMTIHTREGRLVYQTNSAFRPWDGKFMSDNQAAPEGVYIWTVAIKGEELYRGSVTLLK